jgi:hypothetical protein
MNNRRLQQKVTHFSEVNQSRLNAMCDEVGKEEDSTVSNGESRTHEIMLKYICALFKHIVATYTNATHLTVMRIIA